MRTHYIFFVLIHGVKEWKPYQEKLRSSENYPALCKRVNLYLLHSEMKWESVEDFMNEGVVKMSVYTSAGAGPVSFGLVTVLALLLTCRGQCRGDMTHTHFSDTHVHTYACTLVHTHTYTDKGPFQSDHPNSCPEDEMLLKVTLIYRRCIKEGQHIEEKLE